MRFGIIQNQKSSDNMIVIYELLFYKNKEYHSLIELSI